MKRLKMLSKPKWKLGFQRRWSAKTHLGYIKPSPRFHPFKTKSTKPRARFGTFPPGTPKPRARFHPFEMKSTKPRGRYGTFSPGTLKPRARFGTLPVGSFKPRARFDFEWQKEGQRMTMSRITVRPAKSFRLLMSRSLLSRSSLRRTEEVRDTYNI